MAAINITKDNFDKEVLASKTPVLIDFWAPWCGPCRRLSPILEELADDLEGRVKVGKVNVDEQSELADRFSVMSIPMLAVLREGRLTAASVGIKRKDSIMRMLEE